ncbi:MAG: hypothetical protein ACE5JR_06555 [Gemmatimonadota bacterium]
MRVAVRPAVLFAVALASPVVRPLEAQVVIVTTSAEEPTLADRTLRHFIAERLIALDVPVLRSLDRLGKGQVCLEYVVSVLELERGRYDAAIASSVLLRRDDGGVERTRPRILHQFHEWEDLREMGEQVAEAILEELASVDAESP